MFNRTIRIYSYLFLDNTVRTWVTQLFKGKIRLFRYILLCYTGAVDHPSCIRNSDATECHLICMSVAKVWSGTGVLSGTWVSSGLQHIWQMCQLIWLIWLATHLEPSGSAFNVNKGKISEKETLTVNIHQCLKENFWITHTGFILIYFGFILTYIGFTLHFLNTLIGLYVCIPLIGLTWRP